MTEEVLETLSFKMITDGYIDILHSEYRNKERIFRLYRRYMEYNSNK